MRLISLSYQTSNIGQETNHDHPWYIHNQLEEVPISSIVEIQQDGQQIYNQGVYELRINK